MHRIASIVLVLLIATQSFAQLPSGSIAPNFSATDINGQSWNLYQLLESGKVVVLEVSATWCPPCWAYHNSHALQDFYAAHGPTGDNKVQVLFIEGDPATNLNCLYGAAGCNNYSPGNWVTGTEYPIIDNAAIADLYNITYYPTLFAICPNKKVYEIGQLNADGLWEKSRECPVAAGVHNAGIFYYDKGTPFREICGDAALQTQFTLINLGSAPLASANIELRWNNNIVDTIYWTGNLPTYGETAIQFESLPISEPGTLKTSVTYINNGADEDQSNNHRSDQFILASSFNSQQALLKIRTDQFGAETYWELHDENGTVLDFGGNQNVGPDGGGMFPGGINNGPGAYGNNVIIKDTLELPAGGCFSLHFVDAYGDGMCCGYGNGYYKVYNLDNLVIPVISGGEFNSNDDRAFGAPTLTNNSEEPSAAPGMLIEPNPASEFFRVTAYFPGTQPIYLDVYDAYGTPVWHRQEAPAPLGPTVWTVDTADWPSGLYFVTLRTEDDSRVKKVLVVR